MDPENQALIKRIVEEFGADDIVVMLGAGDAEAVEVAAETVRDGDPAWVGPLAGVQLGLPVLHVFEDEVKEQADRCRVRGADRLLRDDAWTSRR